MNKESDTDRDPKVAEDIVTIDFLNRLVNPLSVVRGYSQLLRRRLRRGGTIDDDELLEKLDLIEEAASVTTSNLQTLADKLKEEGAEPVQSRNGDDVSSIH